MLRMMGGPADAEHNHNHQQGHDHARQELSAQHDRRMHQHHQLDR
jgi:hypothetical protein